MKTIKLIGGFHKIQKPITMHVIDIAVSKSSGESYLVDMTYLTCSQRARLRKHFCNNPYCQCALPMKVFCTNGKKNYDNFNLFE